MDPPTYPPIDLKCQLFRTVRAPTKGHLGGPGIQAPKISCLRFEQSDSGRPGRMDLLGGGGGGGRDSGRKVVSMFVFGRRQKNTSQYDYRIYNPSYGTPHDP